MTKTRHGSLFDVPFIIGIVFVIALTVLFSHLILTTIIDNTTDDQIDQETLNKAKTAIEIYDFGILLIAAGLFLAAIVFAFLIPTHPLFVFPALIFAAIAIWFSAEIANIFQLVVNVGAMTGTANSFPNMVELFKRYPYIIAFFTMLLIVALYAKIEGFSRRVSV